MSCCRFGIGGCVILIALHVQLAHAQLMAKPPAGSFKAGQRVLVEDGSCAAEQIKEVIGGSDLKTVNVGCGGLNKAEFEKDIILAPVQSLRAQLVANSGRATFDPSQYRQLTTDNPKLPSANVPELSCSVGS